MAAVNACCNISNRIVPITGGPGTGKTTILKNVYNILYSQKHKVALCAPTGKAAKRITEATGIEATTIHRLLEYPFPGERDPKTGKALLTTVPKRDNKHPVEASIVLCDEYAMVNVEVHRNLLNALPTGGVIRMFGDANQLQPIESNKRLQAQPSSFLKMLDKFDGITLTNIHRQEAGSGVITNCARILKGQMPIRCEDFDFKITNKPVEVILDFIQDKLHEDIDFGTTDNQIISPTRVGWVGSDALNSAIQQVLQPMKQKCTIVDRHKWSAVDELRIYKNDKVIFTVNNYSLEVFNGETGIVEDILDDGSIRVNFGDKTVDIPVELEMEGKRGTYYCNPQKDLDLAYVITTHKTQGSEYDNICYVMNRSRSYLLNRKNFLTACSRAKKNVMVITDTPSLNMSLNRKGER